MTEPSWTELSEATIKARPEDGVWQQALPYVEGPGLLKIEATGQWVYAAQFARPCSANGDLLSPLDPKRCIHEKSPVGALIGRIGGSIADKDTAAIFVVGTLCVRKLEKDTAGPLFFAINDMWNGFGDNSGELKIKIHFYLPPAGSGS
jgi:hypothetical protein